MVCFSRSNQKEIKEEPSEPHHNLRSHANSCKYGTSSRAAREGNAGKSNVQGDGETHFVRAPLDSLEVSVNKATWLQRSAHEMSISSDSQ